MQGQFFTAFTSEPQNGVFLFIGHEINKGFSIAFVLPEDKQPDIDFGKIIIADLDGPTMFFEGNGFICASLKGIDPQLPRQKDAGRYMEAIAAFMTENGWTEEAETDDLQGTLAEMRDAMSIFPS